MVVCAKLVYRMIHKAVIQCVGGKYVGVFTTGKPFNRSLVGLSNLPESLSSIKQAVLVSSPELVLCMRLPDTDRSIVDAEVSVLVEELGLDLSKLTVYITVVNVGKRQQETLLVMVQQDKLDGVLTEFTARGCRVVKLLPEQLAVHKIIEAEITPGETQLVMHVREKFTQLYLLDKFGPVKTYPTPIANEELIPTVQKFIKGQEYCRQGVYFGKRSLSFDQKLFEEQTKVRLSDGVKSLQRFAQSQAQDISNITDLDERVPVLAATLGFKEKELLAKVNPCTQ